MSGVEPCNGFGGGCQGMDCPQCDGTGSIGNEHETLYRIQEYMLCNHDFLVSIDEYIKAANSPLDEIARQSITLWSDQQ